MLKDTRGVFGLTSVQAFFTIILGLALLAYVIVVIMGVLNANSTLFPDQTLVVINETGWINTTPYTVSMVNQPGFNTLSVILVNNRTQQYIINAANFTTSASAGTITGTGQINWSFANITYQYAVFGTAEQNGVSILGNTSAGLTSFFVSINPVYAILAILVIILVLVVLVRVVSGGSGNFGGGQSREPQL